MDQASYDAVIDGFARECILRDPDDPTAESMEFANGYCFCSNEEVFKFTHSLVEASEQNASYPDDQYKENVIAVDCVDWDVCKRIHVLQDHALLLDGSEVQV